MSCECCEREDEGFRFDRPRTERERAELIAETRLVCHGRDGRGAGTEDQDWHRESQVLEQDNVRVGQEAGGEVRREGRGSRGRARFEAADR